MKIIKYIVILMVTTAWHANTNAKEPLKKLVKEPTQISIPKIENKNIALPVKKFIIKSIYIEQSFEEFKDLNSVTEAKDFKCKDDKSLCTFESTVLGSKANFTVSFLNMKINEINVFIYSDKPVIEPAFVGNELSDYLNSEYGASEVNIEDFDMKSWLSRYFQIFTTYTCLKENRNEPEFIKNGCIVDGLRKINFGIDQSAMTNGTLNLRVSSYSWKTKEEIVNYEKIRGKYHPKLVSIYKNHNFTQSGNWDVLIINRENESKNRFFNKKIKSLFEEKFFDNLHDSMEKETGIKIRPNKAKTSDF